MTPLIRRYIKTSFIFLLTGLLLGAYIVAGQFVLDAYPPRLLITAHAHLLFVGFMVMMVMGVATWMFPRPARDDTRYRPELAEAVYWVMAIFDGTARRSRDQCGDSGSARPAAAHRAGGARPARRNRSLRAEHVVARAHAPGGRAARPLR
jgi:hypothetical protein